MTTYRCEMCGSRDEAKHQLWCRKSFPNDFVEFLKANFPNDWAEVREQLAEHDRQTSQRYRDIPARALEHLDMFRLSQPDTFWVDLRVILSGQERWECFA